MPDDSFNSITKSKFFRWIVLFFATFSLYLLAAQRRGFGLFIEQLNVDFNESVSLPELNLIGSAYSCFSHIFTVFTTPLVVCVTGIYAYQISQITGALLIGLGCVASALVPNPHFLFLTFSLLHGLGSAVVFSVAGLVVNNYFADNDHFHVFANTIISGNAAAALIFINLFDFLLDNYQWRNTFLILSLIYFFPLSIASVCYLKNKELVPADVCLIMDEDELFVDEETKRKASTSDVEKKITCSRTSGIKMLLLLLFGMDRIFSYIVMYSLLLNLPTFIAISFPKNAENSSTILNLYLAGETASYIICVLLPLVTGELLVNKLRFVMLATTAINTVILFCWAEFCTKTILANLIFAFLCGLLFGPSISFQFPVAEELTTMSAYLSYPFTLATTGIGIFVSPSMSSVLAELFSFKYVFVAQGFVMAAKFLCILMGCIILKFENTYVRRKAYEELPYEKGPIIHAATKPAENE